MKVLSKNAGTFYMFSINFISTIEYECSYSIFWTPKNRVNLLSKTTILEIYSVSQSLIWVSILVFLRL